MPVYDDPGLTIKPVRSDNDSDEDIQLVSAANSFILGLQFLDRP